LQKDTGGVVKSRIPAWCIANDLYQSLEPAARLVLQQATTISLHKGDVLFHPGDPVRGFVLLLSGHVGVYLSGQGGRDILLYDIRQGQTCVQTTLGLMNGEAYSAEALCESDCALAVVSPSQFQTLLADSPEFRVFVFRSFSQRMHNMMRLLEQVAFVRVEARLAAALQSRGDPAGCIHATHQELATMIGTAREVVSRRLLALAKRGVVSLDRGQVRIVDPEMLAELSKNVSVL